jgi:hypothetical protein
LSSKAGGPPVVAHCAHRDERVPATRQRITFHSRAQRRLFVFPIVLTSCDAVWLSSPVASIPV